MFPPTHLFFPIHAEWCPFAPHCIKLSWIGSTCIRPLYEYRYYFWTSSFSGLSTSVGLSQFVSPTKSDSCYILPCCSAGTTSVSLRWVPETSRRSEDVEVSRTCPVVFHVETPRFLRPEDTRTESPFVVPGTNLSNADSRPGSHFRTH